MCLGLFENLISKTESKVTTEKDERKEWKKQYEVPNIKGYRLDPNLYTYLFTIEPIRSIYVYVHVFIFFQFE